MSRASVAIPVIPILTAALLAFAGSPLARGAEAVSPTAVLARLKRQGDVNLVDRGRALAPAADRTLAPYLVVGGSEGQDERLPLEETSADVTIAGVIARVQVHQLFANRGKRPIEAIYVFPASTRAAVHGMRMKIGGRVIEARIDRRQAARRAYEAARQNGQRTSLLEQQRPNVFTMNVANIMPGDRIAVELDYSELLVPEDATYEFVYPAVVGPRYGGGADPKQDGWIANPYLPAGQPEPYRFSLRAHVETGIPLKELASPSHEVKVSYAGPNRADVTLAQPGGGNRDFVLRYRLAGDRVETGALVWEGEGPGGQRESFFALMVEPPRRPTPAQIPPREYIFLLDVSGSMEGFPLDTAKALMRDLLRRLRPTDSFNVVLFSGAAATLAPAGSLPATPRNVARAIQYVESQRGGGGTELMGGLAASYGIPQAHAGIARSVVVVTDGYVGVEAQAFRFIRERLGDANLFAFGIGSSVNRALIEGMARAGLGEPFVVLGPEKAAAAAEKLRAYIEQPVLTDIHVDFQGVDAVEVAPARVPDLMARRPLVIYGKLAGSANGRIVVSGMTGQGRFEQAVALRQVDVRAQNAPLRWLWARKWVETLDDERHMGGGQPVEEAITRLGLGYELLTAFTSFVAVDSAVVNAGGAGESVRQPLPLPEGVSNRAVGYAPSASPMKMTAHDKLDDLLEGELSGALGGLGTGHGGGGMGLGGGLGSPRAKAAAPHPTSPKAETAPPPVAPPEGAGSRTLRLGVTVTGTSGVGDPRALVERLKQLVRRGPACLGGHHGSLTLKLTVDGAGKVIGVALVRGDRQVLACLEPSLTGLVSATKAAAQAGTVEVVMAL
jgi:Ca-activated chloride channel family protein